MVINYCLQDGQITLILILLNDIAYTLHSLREYNKILSKVHLITKKIMYGPMMYHINAYSLFKRMVMD